MAAIGTALIGVLMVIICADVVARNMMGASLPMVSELGALALVMIVYLQLATTIRHDRLARTELFVTGFVGRHPRLGALLHAFFDFLGLASLAVIAWATIKIVGRDFSSGEYIGVTGVATLPTWPFKVAIVAGMIVSAIEFFLQVIRNLQSVAGKENNI
jgi:TRAP-type mannitol/chloroaromatic compound transport system permease small subunit